MQYRFNFSVDSWNCNQLIVIINSNTIFLFQVEHGMTFPTSCCRTAALLVQLGRNILEWNVTVRCCTAMSIMHKKFSDGSVGALAEAEDLTHFLPCWQGQAQCLAHKLGLWGDTFSSWQLGSSGREGTWEMHLAAVKDSAFSPCWVLFCARESELNSGVSLDAYLCSPCADAAFYL